MVGLCLSILKQKGGHEVAINIIDEKGHFRMETGLLYTGGGSVQPKNHVINLDRLTKGRLLRVFVDNEYPIS